MLPFLPRLQVDQALVAPLAEHFRRSLRQDFDRNIYLPPSYRLARAFAVSHPDLLLPALYTIVYPSPATHAVWRQLKAGESVFEAFPLTNKVFLNVEGHNRCSTRALASEHCLGHLLAPPLMNS